MRMPWDRGQHRPNRSQRPSRYTDNLPAMSREAAGIVRTGVVYAYVREVVASRNAKSGEPNGWVYHVQYIAMRDPQKPLAWCGHRHRTAAAAWKCADATLGGVVAKLLASGELIPTT